MLCPHPILLRTGVYVPCGKCFACLANRQSDWSFRLELEKEYCSFFLWLTLTYDDEHVPLSDDGRPMVNKADCRQFFERLRKHFPSYKFKHFLVSEYGTQTFRPHYHLLLFVDVDSTNTAFIRGCKQELLNYLEFAWGKGFAYNKNFHRHVFGYVTKYCQKPDLIGLDVPAPTFQLISQGIGAKGLEKYDVETVIANKFRTGVSSKSRMLPRYLRHKMECKKLSLLPNYDARLLWTQEMDSVSQIQQLQMRERRLALARDYERRNGPGSWNRLQKAKADAGEMRFINKLKSRKDV